MSNTKKVAKQQNKHVETQNKKIKKFKKSVDFVKHVWYIKNAAQKKSDAKRKMIFEN